jgi:NAD(P)-dependent dehydrogenase (short-subunit alcohol dehydrogenase family)
MANELGQYKIRVNTVHPAGVATGMQMAEMGPLFEKHAATLSPIFMNALPTYLTEPEEIAAAVAWLCSDEAGQVTGAQIPVDMGNLNR